MQHVYNLLTITGKYTIIGSASDKSIKYVSDYDLQEYIKKPKFSKNILDDIYEDFLDKFEKAKANPKIFITDFKCGMDTNDEPLRWNYYDMKRGSKKLTDGRDISFQQAMTQKTTCKMDIIALINGLFCEFSENYNFKIGDHMK